MQKLSGQRVIYRCFELTTAGEVLSVVKRSRRGTFFCNGGNGRASGRESRDLSRRSQAPGREWPARAAGPARPPLRAGPGFYSAAPGRLAGGRCRGRRLNGLSDFECLSGEAQPGSGPGLGASLARRRAGLA